MTQEWQFRLAVTAVAFFLIALDIRLGLFPYLFLSIVVLTVTTSFLFWIRRRRKRKLAEQPVPEPKPKKNFWKSIFAWRGFLLGSSLNLAATDGFFLVFPWYYAIGLTLIFLGYFGIAGLIKIDIGFRGVPILFGGRWTVEWILPSGRVVLKALFELREGWNWILPKPFMGAEAIDVREQSTEVPEFTVVALGSISQDPEDISSVRITIKPSTIRWKIVNPAQSLSIGEEVIRKSLVELVQNTLRQKVSCLSDIEALRVTDGLRNDIQTEADEQATDWGVDVVTFLMGEISLPKEVHEDYEKLRREERQRRAEKLELDHVRERLNELIAMGYTRERAQEIVQTERGKIKKEVRENQISVSSETGQVIERIAGLFRR